MRKPSTRTARLAALLATPVAILATGALIFQASYAAFSSTTRNSGNDWSTGAVTLTNDSAGTARFQVTNMVPGQSDTKCITVTANVSVAGVVKGYVVNPVPSANGLENYIFVTAVEGTGGSFAGCTGFTPGATEINHTSLANLTLASNYASGVGNWAVSPGTQSRTYQISWIFDTTGLTQTQIDALQGTHTGLDFQWELQSS